MLRGLNILVVGNWDYAGCGAFLASALNKYTPHNATSVRLHASTFGFQSDYSAPSAAELAALWKRADVIHIHDAWTSPPPMAMSKPTVVTYHGTLYRSSPDKYNAIAAANGWLETAATLDLTSDKVRWLPDTRPTLPLPQRAPKFKVCHAPSNRARKGTAKIIEACKGLDLELVEGVQWPEAVRRKATAWVTVDQFTYGYGCNSHEAWQMRQAVVSGGDAATLEKIRKRAGKGVLPFAAVPYEAGAIREALLRLRDDHAHYEEMVERGFAYYDKWHAARSVAHIAAQFYQEAIELSAGPRAPKSVVAVAQVAAPRSPMLMSVSGNVGRETVRGLSGREYHYRGGVPFAVDERDISTLLALRSKARGKGRSAKAVLTPLFVRVG